MQYCLERVYLQFGTITFLIFHLDAKLISKNWKAAQIVDHLPEDIQKSE